MAVSEEHYRPVVTTFSDTESLTALVVAGSDVASVADALRLDLSDPADDDALYDADDGEHTAWRLHAVPGGVLAVEGSGYGDPTAEQLASLSRTGAAAVVRSNIQGHFRVGCARAGNVLFDDDEILYVEDPDVVPAEFRALFDLIWDDLQGPVEDDGHWPFAVGMAMAEVATGIEITPEHVAAVENADAYVVALVF